MRISLHGRTEAAGFIMLRGIVVMLIVLFCFSIVCTTIAVFSRQGARMIENVQLGIEERNTAVTGLLR